jgi:hypothetical protein
MGSMTLPGMAELQQPLPFPTMQIGRQG